MKILVKTLSVNNKTNKTIYLTDMVQINLPIEIPIPCSNDGNLQYVDPINVTNFLNQYAVYFKVQNELILSLVALNLQPLKI